MKQKVFDLNELKSKFNVEYFFTVNLALYEFDNIIFYMVTIT